MCNVPILLFFFIEQLYNIRYMCTQLEFVNKLSLMYFLENFGKHPVNLDSSFTKLTCLQIKTVKFYLAYIMWQE